MSDEFPISISKEFRYPLIINSMHDKKQKKRKKKRNRAKTELLLSVHKILCVRTQGVCQDNIMTVLFWS